ncbi:DUF2189 domain-containing protein [Neoroseomonas soli]|uniref:DUF2189 domain-containing protein n=1 Tax=Neoroseomonas soli TaxID=1081025 RepID=A0A9X9WR90_9PROT|nr:DUF2189 domain-containing protein [Neoroseomonas soli]MBR0669669.1 DUF2189 domain-containing protein [Neoroseomonas soli]
MAHVSLLSEGNPDQIEPAVRAIGFSDIRIALTKGYADFTETPTQLVFLGIIYPIVGFVAARAASGGALLPLLYPLVAGLSLMGPIAALGIYELSRRREKGLPTSWLNAFDVLRSPAMPTIAALGLVMCVVFVAWLYAAQMVYRATMGDVVPGSIWGLLGQVLTTSAGWSLILWGHIVGFFFAALILTLTVVSFPLLLDRNVGLRVAVWTSVRAVFRNPIPMAAWGIIVAVLLALGCLPIFVGLAVVMPILGHATWHLYRRVVEA